MAGFKRVPLRGSDELFRPTGDPSTTPDIVVSAIHEVVDAARNQL